MKAGSRGKPQAWIFGAGITGLSAAHELIERGFAVKVYEPTPDPRFADRPALGGVARTQFAWIPLRGEPPVAGEDPASRRIPRTIPRVRLPQLGFSDEDLSERGEPRLSAQNATKLDALRDRLAAIAQEGEGLVQLSVVAVAGTTSPSRTTPGESPQVPMQLARSFAGLVVDALKDRLPAWITLNLGRPVQQSTSEGPRVRLEWMAANQCPGEHGFRYFPGFYRHLFDTMHRTVVSAGETPQAARFTKTARDNLTPTEATWLVVKNRDPRPDDAPGPYELVSFPRRQPRSPRQLFEQVQSFLRDLGYSSSDLARLSLKLFQYMTCSSERRAAEFEDTTWWDFIEGERFSPICRDHMDRGPEVLGAMTAKESDARTQGNCVVQLLIDQIIGRELTDATLNGPTTEAWFDLWHEYLTRQGVQFLEGRLGGFRQPRGAERPDVLLPIILDEQGQEIEEEFAASTDHWFFVCASATAMMGFPEFRPGGGGNGDTGLADLFVAAHETLQKSLAEPLEAGSRDDFARVIAWRDAMRAEHTQRGDDALGLGALRHLTGVQFLFGANLQFGQEHTLYMDSPWRLSSISQTHFWQRFNTTARIYRGIVSVDLGALHQPDEENRRAWDCDRDEIARRVWAQVAPSVARETTLSRRDPWSTSPGGGPIAPAQGPAHSQPVAVRLTLLGPEEVTIEPLAYHIDENLEFERTAEGEHLVRNTTPYLINRPREFRLRPGVLREKSARTQGYERQNHRWLLAGTYMKTFTRLTTMEAANESARHAVNAVLHALELQGDRCMIWDPEESEIPDLEYLRAIDRKLFLDGYPHMVDILGLEAIPDMLLPDAPVPGDR